MRPSETQYTSNIDPQALFTSMCRPTYSFACLLKKEYPARKPQAY
jgi:hypothetical protein